MELTKIKISYIISVTDRRYSKADSNYLKLILDNNLKIPSVTLDVIEADGHMRALESLCGQYLKYDPSYLSKSLCGFRTFDNLCEVIYFSSVNYMLGLNKTGRIFSLGEIQEQQIEIEDYYGKLFTEHSGRTY